MKRDGISPAAFGALAKCDIENFVVASTPGGIEAQEARGQKQFVNASTLPIRHDGCTRADFEKFGVVYCENVDDLFVNVTLPDGWKKVATDHSMWSHLVDNRGRQRASIFYKAAFYDRSAHIAIDRRFSIHKDYDREPDIVFVVKDCGNAIFSTEPVAKPEAKWWEVDGREKNIAEAWLAEHYPNWKDATAYWD